MGRLTMQGTNGYYAPVELLESDMAEDGFACECKEWCEKQDCCDPCPIQSTFDRLGEIEDAYEEYNAIIQKTALADLGEEKLEEMKSRLMEKIRAILG